MVYLYHERQVAALCGQHCLNNLMQGPHFTTGDLADIAMALDQQERKLMMEAGMTATWMRRWFTWQWCNRWWFGLWP